MPTFATRSEHERPFGLAFLLVHLTFVAFGAKPDSTRHLLDFSTDRSTVVVDPLLDLAWGPVRPAPETAWLNIRGATFAANWDGQWRAWGSLEEHQSIRTGAEAWWTAMNGSLPGWGRAKLGRDGGQWRTADSLYADVARAEGGVQWRAPQASALAGLSAKAAIERWDWGLDEATLGTISKHASTAPSPCIELAWAGPSSITSVQIRKWVLDERGPLGATSESLFEWTQSYALEHERRLGQHVRAGAVVGHTRLAEADRLAASGWDKPAKAWWLGGHIKWAHRGWWIGAEAATEWTRGFVETPLMNEGGRWVVACGKVWSEGQITLQHLQRPGTPEDRARHPADLTLLTHAGLPMGTVWSQATSVSWVMAWARLGDLKSNFTASQTDFGENISIDFIKRINEKWPIDFGLNVTHWISHSQSIAQIRFTWDARPL